METLELGDCLKKTVSESKGFDIAARTVSGKAFKAMLKTGFYLE